MILVLELSYLFPCLDFKSTATTCSKGLSDIYAPGTSRHLYQRHHQHSPHQGSKWIERNWGIGKRHDQEWKERATMFSSQRQRRTARGKIHTHYACITLIKYVQQVLFVSGGRQKTNEFNIFIFNLHFLQHNKNQSYFYTSTIEWTLKISSQQSLLHCQ